ncbi:hypothetical protein [Alteromonas lipolytica]|uniref:Uncharacterized protein n=1 Tax=Alteromonas lipolytica TaxID=1856405 RepID=A0A1E8FCU3_9ALTE|nr:hypothetical protein [Alteromonas lipolytica]OFI33744.1 hypothetical protein BFC17_19400 [Alteromonas lipolytica]GGF68791.1 hypothetical protein GCM10011338_21250 [Alteromonas lipolytica]
MIVDVMGFRDPQQTLTWINEQTDTDTHALTQQLLAQSVMVNPQFADNQLHLIEDETARLGLSAQIYINYEKHSQAKADDFLLRQPDQQHLTEEIARQQKDMAQW